MTEQEALIVLRLASTEESSTSTSYTEKEVRRAFSKLALRYPAESFPERFYRIREAFDVLTNPVKSFTSILEDERLDLGFLSKFLRPVQARKRPRVLEPKDYLADLQRNLLVRGYD